MKGRFVSVLGAWLVLALALAAAIWVAAPAGADAPTLLNYQGRLTDAGGAPINGTPSMTFGIYSAVSGGSSLWSETQSVTVTNGLFSVLLGSSTALPASVFDGTERYLEVQVGTEILLPRQRIASAPYSLRTGAPQSLSSSEPGAVISVTNTSASGWGLYGLATSGPVGVLGQSYADNGSGVTGLNPNPDGGRGVRGHVIAGFGTTYGVWGQSDSFQGTGVYGLAPSVTGTTYGVYGLSRSTSGIGVQGHVTSTSGTTYGGYFQSDSTLGRAVYGYAPASGGNSYGGYFVSGSRGIHVEGYSYGGEFNASAPSGVADAVYAASAGTSGRGVVGIAGASSGTTIGVWGESYSTGGRGIQGYASASSGTTIGGYFSSASTGGRGVFGYVSATSGTTYGGYLESGSTSGTGVFGYAQASSGATYGVYGLSASTSGYGGFFVNTNSGILLAANNVFTTTDLEFKVDNVGNVYADGTYSSPASDFAELMAFESASGGRSRYEPGDVLVISTEANQTVALSQEPYSTLVAGVYSTKPGFLGGGSMEGAALTHRLPVAMMGIVPTKVSAENGPIRRGDLLVTSGTPGHAMRAEDPRPGTVLGKALEPLDAGTGTILVLVTLQ